MHICSAIKRFISISHPGKDARHKCIAKEPPHPDATFLDSPLTAQMREGNEALLEAKAQIKQRHLHQCLDTVEQAIATKTVFYRPDYLVLRTYVLFALERDEEACDTAKDAYRWGGKTALVMGLTCCDADVRARLRKRVPVRGTQATPSHRQ